MEIFAGDESTRLGLEYDEYEHEKGMAVSEDENLNSDTNSYESHFPEEDPSGVEEYEEKFVLALAKDGPVHQIVSN